MKTNKVWLTIPEKMSDLVLCLLGVLCGGVKLYVIYIFIIKFLNLVSITYAVYIIWNLVKFL